MDYEIMIPRMDMYDTLLPEEKKEIFGVTPYTISGGDIPTIMGVNPYETNVELFKRKIRPRKREKTPEMERGIDYEAATKLMFKHEYRGIFKQTGFNAMIRSTKTPYLIGVPDDILITETEIKNEENEVIAVSGEKMIHEIKSKYLIKKEAGFKTIDENMYHYVNFVIPMYEMQMQLYLYLTGLKFGVYTISIVSAPFYTSDRKTIVTSRILERDDVRIEVMLKEADEFYQRLLSKKEPAIKQRSGGI